MSTIGTIHLVASVAAIVVGAVVLMHRPKGGRRHRQLGWTYVVAMLTVNATAFMIYGLFGGFGPFHVAAVISLAGIVAGVLAARSARKARTGAASIPPSAPRRTSLLVDDLLIRGTDRCARLGGDHAIACHAGDWRRCWGIVRCGSRRRNGAGVRGGELRDCLQARSFTRTVSREQELSVRAAHAHEQWHGNNPRDGHGGPRDE